MFRQSGTGVGQDAASVCRRPDVESFFKWHWMSCQSGCYVDLDISCRSHLKMKDTKKKEKNRMEGRR